MRRLIDLALIAIAIGGAVWTYQTKHEAELSAKHLSSLRSQIIAQDRKISLLEADTAIASSPARLEKLAQQYAEQLKLAPLASSQIVDLTELPALRTERESSEEETYAGSNGDIVTGGIGALIIREASQ